jgi:hypothetical protein
MRFEMIGMQFDKTRHDQVAARIVATAWRITLAEFGDASTSEGDPALVDDAVGKNDPGVADDGFGR